MIPSRLILAITGYNNVDFTVAVSAERDRLGIGRDENRKEEVRCGKYIKSATNYYKPTGGKRVAKRIDYIFVPEVEGAEWDLLSSPTKDGLLHDFYPTLQENGMPDHIAVTARAYFAEGAERGTGLDSVSEAIYESPAVQSKAEAILA